MDPQILTLLCLPVHLHPKIRTRTNGAPRICRTLRYFPIIIYPKYIILLALYYYLIESFKRKNEYDLMQNEDNDAGGLAPVKEADEVML